MISHGWRGIRISASPSAYPALTPVAVQSAALPRLPLETRGLPCPATRSATRNVCPYVPPPRTAHAPGPGSRPPTPTPARAPADAPAVHAAAATLERNKTRGHELSHHVDDRSVAWPTTICRRGTTAPPSTASCTATSPR